jgi:hypothetical protein
MLPFPKGGRGRRRLTRKNLIQIYKKYAILKKPQNTGYRQL